MKHYRYFSLLAALVLALTAMAQNRLSIPATSCIPGADIDLPVLLDNSREVVGVQFDIHLPFSLNPDKDVTLNADRNPNSHSVALRSIGYNAYTVVVVNLENKPLGGNSGTLLNFPLKVSADAVPGKDYDINISNIVITDNKGDNIAYSTDESGKLSVLDLVPISLSLDKSEYTEGETIHLSIGVPKRIAENDLTVALQIEQAKRFKLPSTCTFAQDALLAEVDIPILQDNVPANESEIMITVSAPGHATGTVAFTLIDDDVPAISLDLTPDAVSEGQGPNAIYGTVKRQGATNSKITLRLSDDGNDELYYASPITMAEGVTEVTFPIGVKDNQMVDGDRCVNFTAEVFITDCNCSAIGDLQTSVTKSITIYDNDGPALTLTADKSTVLEGDSQGAVLTISRNTSADSDLAVALSANADDMTFPSSVVIPKGEKSINAQFVALANEVVEGNRTVSIKATADGFSTGTLWLLITDRTLPDISVANTQLPSGDIPAGQPFTVTIPVENIGAATMPEGANVVVSLNDNPIASTTIDTEIAPGETRSVDINIDGIIVPGLYTIAASVNSDHRFNELQYINNSVSSSINVTPIHSFTIKADKDTYNIGDEVVLCGDVTNSDGEAVAGVDVETYLILSNVRTALLATSDAKGNFTVRYTIPEGMCGDYTYGVCVPGEALSSAVNSFSVYGILRSSNEYIKNYLYVDEPYQYTISIQNPCSKPLHNLRAEVSDPSGIYDVQVDGLGSIDGGSKANLDVTMTAKALSTTKDWDQIVLNISCDEGAALSVNTYNYTRNHNAQLTSSESSINTTVSKNQPRVYSLTVSNQGQGETGIITVSVPDALKDLISVLSPVQMPSLNFGETAAVTLRLDGANYDINLLQKGTIAINCENGNGIAIPFTVKVVSEDKGALLVKVQDETTVYGTPDGEHPYLAGANVRITDYNTGEVVAAAATGADGSTTFDSIDEGYYHLFVSADNHDSYSQTVLVSPGVTTEHIATISYQAVTVTWTVEETTVEDSYLITPTVTYETQVPVPVLLLDIPEVVPISKLHTGESLLFDCKLENKGLIAALHVHLDFPEISGYTFYPLVEASDFDIAPEQTVIVPVLVSCQDMGSEPGDKAPCYFRVDAGYQWACASLDKYATSSDVASTGKPANQCAGNSGAWTSSAGGGGGGGIGGPWGGGGGGAVASGASQSAVYSTPVTCQTVETMDGTKNICAYVTLQFENRLYFTRQAFRGTLTIENNSGGPLTDISADITALNPEGIAATAHEMQISVESINGFDGEIDGVWSLDNGKTGVATILFIPSQFAAPDTVTTYRFGGTLYFNDGKGLQSRGLYPVALQVKPTPLLDLTYFLQRDIYGDNPLTSNVKEPMIPAEFSVLLHNKGKGDAENVRLLTKQPRIIENDNGLDIDFAIIGASLNGQEQAIALNDDITTEIGTIASGASAYVTWSLVCKYLGHFVDYDVDYTHLSSYGNPDLSLLDRVTIHALTHSVNALKDGIVCRAWATCDGSSDCVPNHIYFADGTDLPLEALVDATSVERVDNDSYRISVEVGSNCWFYTKVSNMFGNNCHIISVIDETTGEAIDADNAWTTDYTIIDRQEPIAENMIHLVACAKEPSSHSYIIRLGQDDARILPESISLSFDPQEDDNADTYSFTIGVTRKAKVTVSPADSYFDPTKLSFDISNSADAPASWDLIEVSNVDCANNVYTCDISINCPEDLAFVSAKYDGPAAAGAVVVSVLPVRCALPYYLDGGWNWMGVPTLTGPTAAEFAGVCLAESALWDTNSSMTAIDNNGHYRLRLTKPLTAPLYGAVNFSPAWTSLKVGSNLVSNPFFFDLKINDYPQLWQNLSDQDMIKGKDGRMAYYDAESGLWTGLLDSLECGKAYVLCTAADLNRIDFPYADVVQPHFTVIDDAADAVTADSLWVYDGSAFQDNMCIAAVINGLEVPDVYSIGAFVGNECRGEGVFKDGIWYICIHGVANEQVSLKLMHTPSRQIFDFDVKIDFAESLGSPKSPFQLFAPEGANDPASLDDMIFDSSYVRIYTIDGCEVTADRRHLLPGFYVIASQGHSAVYFIK